MPESDDEKRGRAFSEDLASILEKHKVTPQEATAVGVSLIQRSYVLMLKEAEDARRRKED